MTLTLTTLPHPLLKTKLKPIHKAEINSEEIRNLINEMRLTMVESKGVGLAANQVNENLQLFVIDKKLAEENNISDVLINPQITEYSKEKGEMEEGCLSIPNCYIPVLRAKKIKIKGYNEKGEKIKFKARGFLARVLQHETDHINGLTIKDSAHLSIKYKLPDSST